MDRRDREIQIFFATWIVALNAGAFIGKYHSTRFYILGWIVPIVFAAVWSARR